MGKKLTVIVDDRLDERFRQTVFKRKGMKRGNITEAVEEAMTMWISTAVPDTDTARAEKEKS